MSRIDISIERSRLMVGWGREWQLTKKMGMMNFYGVMDMLIKLDCDDNYTVL